MSSPIHNDNSDVRSRVYARAFGVSAFAHLTLPDAWQPGWLLPDLLLAGGAVMLLWPKPSRRSTRAGWALSIIGLLWPLVALGDQLTQSVYMLACALVMLGSGKREDGLAAVRALTLLVYGIAAFHKLNADFFNSDVSCATAGVEALSENWSLPLATEALRNVWPALFLATEISLVALFVMRPGMAVVLATAMHIPLTIIFAPSFAWVMAPGWLVFLSEDELLHLWSTARSRWKQMVALGALLGGGSAALYFRDHWVPYPAWQLKELALWMLLALLLVAWWTRTGRLLVGRGSWAHGRLRGVGGVAAMLFALNALTPYLGVQFHHAGAMLSNLRIDQGCWNHLLVPEGVRQLEPYVRVREAEVGEVRGREALESLLEERLWHPASLQSSTARYCDQGAGPIRLSLSYRGELIEVLNACENLDLPWQPAGLYQSNLLRECPQRCIH